MAVNLSSGAITKIVTGKCTENDLKPVLQVFYTDSRMTSTIANKQWYLVALSDGSFWEIGCISKKLQEGSIVQLTKYQFIKDEMEIGILGVDLNVIHSKFGLIGDPKSYPRNETPLVERTAPTIPNEDQVEENVSKMTKLMMEKNKEDDVGSCSKKLEALGEDVSEMSRMKMKICKEDDMGACIEKLDKMGWGAQDPLYDTAPLLFGHSADYRKLWLHLKPESCGNWVKNAGSMFGLLD